MKNFFVLTIITLCFVTVGGSAIAKQASDMPTIKFKGNDYTLLYSAKSQELGSYVNEYYKPRESYASWSELVGIHHYPEAFYPIKHAVLFQAYLDKLGYSNILDSDDENNSAVLDFVVINKEKLPIIVEYNVFKYEKSHDCGTSAFQYAKRIRVNSPLELKDVLDTINSERKRVVRCIKKTSIPDLITKNVENGKYVVEQLPEKKNFEYDDIYASILEYK